MAEPLLTFVLLSAAPALFYIALAWCLDRHEKEPIGLLVMTFLWGALPAAAQSLWLELFVDAHLADVVAAEHQFLVSAVFVAPPVEELFKAAPVLIVFLFWRHEVDGLMDGLLYGALAGFGFAVTENVIYFTAAYRHGGADSVGALFLMRSVAFGMNHALYTSMFGLGLSAARFSRGALGMWCWPVVGWLAGVGLHLIHNLLASLALEQHEHASLYIVLAFLVYQSGCVFWLLLAFAAGAREARWIARELHEEVAAGVLTAAQAAGAHSPRVRFLTRLRSLVPFGSSRAGQEARLYALAAELGMAKRQELAAAHVQGQLRRIAELRHEITQLAYDLNAA